MYTFSTLKLIAVSCFFFVTVTYSVTLEYYEQYQVGKVFEVLVLFFSLPVKQHRCKIYVDELIADKETRKDFWCYTYKELCVHTKFARDRQTGEANK